MFKIVRFPEEFSEFFEGLEDFFLYDHFRYFRDLTLAFAFIWGRRTVSNACRQMNTETHRTRYNNFLNIGRWAPEDALREKAFQLLGNLGIAPGDEVELIIDGSHAEKTGEWMDAVGWTYDNAKQRIIWGHSYVMAVLRFKGMTIPFGIRLWVSEKEAAELAVAFRKGTQFAADLIRQFDPPVEGVRVRVLFDSAFLCPTVLKGEGFLLLFHTGIEPECVHPGSEAQSRHVRGEPISPIEENAIPGAGKSIRDLL
jgi:hypothetical protein